MIPKVIHFIFFGFTKFEFIHYLAVRSAAEVHQPDQIFLYYSQAPVDNPLWDAILPLVELVPVTPPEEFNGVKLESYQYRADILRLQKLIEYGGIYLDIDIISLKPFDKLLNNECVLGIESGDQTLESAESITNAVILCQPNNPFIQDWLAATGNNLKDKHWAYHAVNLPVELLKNKQYNVHLEPKKSFMPFGWREPWIFDDDQSKLDLLEDSYTIHLWETIWQPDLVKVNNNYLKTSNSVLAQLCKKYSTRTIMPTSSPNGKNWISDQLKHIARRISINQVLDIGAGAGTYWNKFNNIIPGTWTAVEVWNNYVEKYELKSKYTEVIVQDARHIDYAALPQQDIVFAGDVLEHMTEDEADVLVKKLLNISRCVIISIPIVHMPQGEWEGNPYEEHVKDDWSDEQVKNKWNEYLVSSSIDNEIGVYILSMDYEFIKSYFKYKIAIYTICKNEEQHVKKWAASNHEADFRLVCDTGSTDQTRELLEQEGVQVVPISVLPWRFDTARNAALNLLPIDIDICIWQDLDEELLPGWRQQLESNWTPNATIANHKYRNNDRPWQWHSKIHARHNCHWTGAVHETLKWTVEEQAIWIPDFYLDEHQDVGKNRSGYLSLLEKKVKEGDKNWRTYYFLANEYQATDLDRAIEQRIKSYETCNEGTVVQSYIAKNIAINYSYKNNNEETERWFEIALKHSPERETLFSFAQYFYNNKDWDRCYIYAKKCIECTTRRDGFTYDPAAWSWHIYDYAALAAYNLGIHDVALDYGEEALKLLPGDYRLESNVDFYDKKTSIPFPDTIEIETSSDCNRTCHACLRNSSPDREKISSWFKPTLMPMEKIKLIFDQAKHIGFKKDLCLSHYNEPLTDPRLVDIIRLAKNYPFAHIIFHSNGDLLTEELAEQIDGLIDWITFSVYATGPIKLKREAQIRSWFKYTDARFTPGILGLTHHGPAEDMEDIIKSVKNLPCWEPRDRFIINHRGEMEFCCDDLGNNYGLGSVTEDTTLHDLWFNTRFQRMVKQLRKSGGRQGLSYCETCPRPTERTYVAKNISMRTHEQS